MNRGTSSLDLIMARFPEHRESLGRLYGRSESFRSLCEDVRECLAALETWSRSMAEEAPAYRKEYAILLHELEEEVLEGLDNEGALIDYRNRKREF
ncbi:MAG TPA: hypothetical protein PKV86_11020 [Syntrophobacteraceae bacterium]|nr:hypothetical protein [Syntrophobacteraceae bacterium]